MSIEGANSLMSDAAKVDGMKVVLPQPNELFVDIDSEEQYSIFVRALKTFRTNYYGTGEVGYRESPSKSGLPKRHITVSLPFDVDQWQRIALQAAFGSDLMRELLSGMRVLCNDPNPTLFLEKECSS